ncbi:MAG: Hypothetical protein AJITA_00813 [Acetilactobacillus jinshanensis]
MLLIFPVIIAASKAAQSANSSWIHNNSASVSANQNNIAANYYE